MTKACFCQWEARSEFKHKVPVGVPHVAQQKRIGLVSMRTRVRSPAPLRGLRIWRCRELCCRSQTGLGPHVAVAGVWAGSCSSDSVPVLGTSLCRGYGPNKQKKQEKKCTIDTSGPWRMHFTRICVPVPAGTMTHLLMDRAAIQPRDTGSLALLAVAKEKWLHSDEKVLLRSHTPCCCGRGRVCVCVCVCVCSRGGALVALESEASVDTALFSEATWTLSSRMFDSHLDPGEGISERMVPLLSPAVL